MPTIRQSERIAGIYIVELKSFSDRRGQFLETFRKEWFPQRSWNVIQCNRSDSHAGVLRGLHYHFHQVDYWYVVKGEIRAGFVDIRQNSPTRGASLLLPMGASQQIGVFIPVGVAHGFVAVSDATLTYVVDNYYDSNDEFGVAWNDPSLKLDWGIVAPIVSQRDSANPRLSEIAADQLPRFGADSVAD